MRNEVRTIDISQQLNFPKVSVVTITYNHGAYIKETMDGVLMQNYPGEIEFIIANDCSSDNSDQVIKEYLATKTIPQNITIKYTNHGTNKGMIPNFIWAMQQTSGTYIALCEGDDFWTHDLKLQKQINFLQENPRFILCGHYVDVLNFKGEIEKKTNIIPVAFSQSDLHTTHIPTLSVVFRNKLETFPEYFMESPSGDFILWTYLGNFGDYYMLDESWATYRQHEGGVWSGVSPIKRIKNSLKSKMLAMNYITDKDKLTVHSLKLCRVGMTQALKSFDIQNLIFFIIRYVNCAFYRFKCRVSKC